jgi:adenylate kinase
VTTVALTGTPGTGKTTVADRVADRLAFDVVHLNDAIREAGLFSERDVERDSLIADLDAVESWLAGRRASDGGDLLIESHLAHLLDADRTVVLRCHPESLKPRLRDRGESAASIAENAESEALDTVLASAVDRHGAASVWEIDTTDRTPEAVADDVVDAIEGETNPRVGVVDFIQYL